jgi:hypothetical protein
MKVKFSKGSIIIELPLIDPPKVSDRGNIIIAQTERWEETDLKSNEFTVVVQANVILSKPKNGKNGK